MRTRRAFQIMLLLACFFFLAILVFWIGWLSNKSQIAVTQNMSDSRFSGIREMLLLYHDKHGAFPPTKFQLVADGPSHSWRVLLVPHTSRTYQDNYSNYDFSQEWNSTNNLHALGNMPYFRYFSISPNPPRRRSLVGDGDITHFLAIGANDKWPSNKPLKSLLVTKGEDRFLIVEYPDSKIHWMEPEY